MNGALHQSFPVFATSAPRYAVATSSAGASRRGLTLVEVMFSIVVMSTMMVAALGSVGGVAKSRMAQKESAQGLSLARQLLAEIVQTRYKDLVAPTFGAETGETRATYDDIDDYNGINQTSASAANGTVLSGATSWRRQVAVAWVEPANPDTVSTSDKGLKRITITVTSPGGRVTTIKALRSDTNGYEHVPGSQVTYTSHVGVAIQVGPSNSTRSIQGANLQNMVP